MASVNKITNLLVEAMYAFPKPDRDCNQEQLARKILTDLPLRTLPGETLLKKIKSSPKEIPSGLECQLTKKKQRKAVKDIAKFAHTTIKKGVSSDETIPPEYRRSAYNDILLHTQDRLQRLRALDLSSAPPDVTLSRVLKNTAATSAGIVGHASSIGLGTVVTATTLAALPGITIAGGIYAARLRFNASKSAESATDRDLDPDYYQFIVNALLPAYIVAGGVGALSYGRIQTTNPTLQKVRNVRDFLNYSRELKNYVDNSHLSTKQIADYTHEVLKNALKNNDPSLVSDPLVNLNSPETPAAIDAYLNDNSATGHNLTHLAIAYLENATLTRNLPKSLIKTGQKLIRFMPRQILPDGSLAEISSNLPGAFVKRPSENWKFYGREPNTAAFNTFSKRLLETEDYAHRSTRNHLIKRVDSLVVAMDESPALRSLCFQIAGEAVLSCNDRIALGLNDMEMAKINHDAEKGTITNKQLFSIGENLFKMSALDEIALKTLSGPRYHGGNADQVEIRLYFHTALAKRLKLPENSRSMLFGHLADISENELSFAENQVKRLLKSKKFPAFLAQWQPWVNLMERTHPFVYANANRVKQQMREKIAIKPLGMGEHTWMEAFKAQEQFEKAEFLNLTAELTSDFIKKNRLH